MRTLLSIFLLVLSFNFSTIASANEDEPPLETRDNKLHPATAFFLAEGMFAVNAYMASKKPRTYGTVAALLFPMAIDGKSNTTTKWVGLIAAESIALYNIRVDEDKKSEKDIFRENMVAWHLFAGAVGLSNLLFDDEESNESLTFSPTPDNGYELVYRYRF